MKLLRILSCQKITYLSAAKQTGIKFRLDMAKVQIKFQKITSFGGFFFVEDQFQPLVMPYVEEFLGRRSQLVG